MDLKIEIISFHKKQFLEFNELILNFFKENNLKFKGPIFFPKKKLKLITRKSPDGEGNEFYDHWRMIKRKNFYKLNIKKNNFLNFINFIKYNNFNFQKVNIKIKLDTD